MRAGKLWVWCFDADALRLTLGEDVGSDWRCFWVWGVFHRIWGDSFEKGEENPFQSFTEEKNPQTMGVVESPGAPPAPQGVHDGRSNLQPVQQGLDLSSPAALEETRMDGHRWELGVEAVGKEKDLGLQLCFPPICSPGRNSTGSLMIGWVLHAGS